MNPGMLVRFKKSKNDIWLIGMLVEWNPSSKEAVVMYNDNLFNIPLARLQRYGKRYLETSKAW